MESVLSVTLMCVLAHLCGSVMSAITGPSKVVVLSVEELGFLMLITVKSALSRRKIEMGVQKSSIWEVPKQIYSTNGRSMASRNGDPVSTLWFGRAQWLEVFLGNQRYPQFSTLSFITYQLT